MKFKKKLMTLLLSLLIISNFACEEVADIEVGRLKKPVDIASVSGNEQNGMLILDNLSNQLFLYDLNDDCYLDFSKEIPLKNGMVLSKYPYKLTVSDDNNKAVVLSSNGVMSIIDLAPYLNFYKKDCETSALPTIEFKKQINEVPIDVVIKKSTGFNYEILLVNQKTIEFYNYNGEEMTLLYNKEFNSKIIHLFSDKDSYYISLEGENSITKISSDGTELVIDLIDVSVDYLEINKFIVTDKYIYVYSSYDKKLFVWDIENNKYIDVKSSYNPLDSNDTNPSKSLRLSYMLNSMVLYKQEYNIEDDEFLNGIGYLNLHQLIEGNYILLTDVGGYFYFLTIDIDKKLITNYSEDDYESLDEYKLSFDKKFLEFQIPLQTDYKAEIISVNQPEYCTQFNKHEANQCFLIVNEDEDEISTNNKFVLLKEEVENREYNLSNDYFKFTYEAALKGFINDDGSFTANNKLNSVNIDFAKITIDADKLLLEIISELPETKIDDSKCEKYKTVIEEQKDEETNRKYYRLVPVKVINGHELTLDDANDPNLSYCYDEAIAFQIRVKDLFVVSTIEYGEIGISTYCTNDKEINPLCSGENTERCPEECETAPFYENNLFKVKIFSDKGDMDIGSYINFSLGVTSTASRYRHEMVSPLKSIIFNNDESKQSKNGIAIVDSYGNNVLIIDTNDFNTVTTVIQ